MTERKDGSIIIVSSIGGLKSSTVIGTYNISKAADIMLVKNLAAEFGPHNVRTNAIAPGLFKTDFARALWENPEILKQSTASCPLRRIGEPDEIGGAAVFLASDAGTFVLAETALDLHCWGENPVVTAKLQLNGQDRFSEREGSYFDVVQPFQHHTRTPDTGINLYSFALRPEEHQPSGTCNFSRIDNATLQLVLSNATVSGTSTAKVRVYATNYNVLRIMSGMGGLAYSN